jgi:hypothetical protein
LIDVAVAEIEAELEVDEVAGSLGFTPLQAGLATLPATVGLVVSPLIVPAPMRMATVAATRTR